MDTVNEILKEELEELRYDIIRQSQREEAWATGDTAKEYEVIVGDDGHGQLAGLPYAGILQTGRKPGKVPYGFKEIILRWIKAKGLQPKDRQTFERMAASIAWVIHKKGTRLHQDGTERDIFDTPLADFTERLTDRLSVYYFHEIQNNIFTWP